MSTQNKSELSVSWDNVVRFVRQLSHDLRNDLNATELQAAYLGELAGDNAELKEEVKRLREMMAKLANNLQRVSSALGKVSPTKMSYRVSEFVEDLRAKIAKDFPTENGAIKWEGGTGETMFEIDPQLLQQAFLEIFTNAFQHNRGEGPIVVETKIDNGNVVFTLREPKSSFDLPTENWGREPLGKARHGHYGLGLNQVRSIVEANGGKFGARHDATASQLVTNITLPISPAGK